MEGLYMASYKSRVIDVTIVNRLRNKGAILVEGAKWCGKTTTCEQHASSILYMSDPDRVKQNLQLADISPRSLLQGETPRLSTSRAKSSLDFLFLKAIGLPSTNTSKYPNVLIVTL